MTNGESWQVANPHPFVPVVENADLVVNPLLWYIAVLYTPSTPALPTFAMLAIESYPNALKTIC